MNPGELAALGELSLWLDALRRETARYEALFAEEQELRQQGVRFPDARATSRASERASVGHWIVIAGHQLVKALRSPDLPQSVRSRDLSSGLKEQLRQLRHIFEHRDDYLPSVAVGKGGAAGEWYETNFPGRTPWSMSWSRGKGVTLAGILDFETMKAELAPLAEAVSASQDELRIELERDD